MKWVIFGMLKDGLNHLNKIIINDMDILTTLNLIVIVLASIGLGFSLGFKRGMKEGVYIGVKTGIKDTIKMIEKKITDDSFKEEYIAIVRDTFSLRKLDLDEEDYKIEKL